MATWRKILRDGMVSGTVASLASTIVLSLSGKQERNSAVAPTNAVSHWFWGDRAFHHKEPSTRYTLLGYAIHHAMSTLWAVAYERCCSHQLQKRSVASCAIGGATVASLACFVDYRLTPHRLQPGFENHLSKTSLMLVYAAFGLGVILPDLLALCKERVHGE